MNKEEKIRTFMWFCKGTLEARKNGRGSMIDTAIVDAIEKEIKDIEAMNKYQCENCKISMDKIFTRDDGLSYYGCPCCGATIGEETEE